jgi:hypothetical protein
MFAYWIIFLFVSMAISIFTMNLVQFRLLRRKGWRHFFRRHSWHEWYGFYWTELSPIQRLLVWTGIVAFFVTLFGAAIGTLLNKYLHGQ